MPSPSHQPSRQQVAAKRLAAALGFAPETAADEWLEAMADAAESSPSVATAMADAYRQRDLIGWSKITARTTKPPLPDKGLLNPLSHASRCNPNGAIAASLSVVEDALNNNDIDAGLHAIANIKTTLRRLNGELTPQEEQATKAAIARLDATIAAEKTP